MSRRTQTPRWVGWAAPVCTFVLVLLLWHAATRVFGLRPFVLPSPFVVASEAASRANALLSATLVTGTAALAGFFLSVLTGCLIGFAFSQSVLVRKSCYPYAIFLQTVPIVAIAPLIILWFGTGLRSVVLVSVIVGLFPMITNSTAGLTSLDRNLVYLFELYGANRLQTLLKLRLPAAVPFIITGAKTSSGLSVIGAIVGEFFAGYGADRHGLGYLIIVTSGQLKTAYLFAAVLCCTMLGLLIFGVVGLLGNAILRHWYRHQVHA